MRQQIDLGVHQDDADCLHVVCQSVGRIAENTDSRRFVDDVDRAAVKPYLEVGLKSYIFA